MIVAGLPGASVGREAADVVRVPVGGDHRRELAAAVLLDLRGDARHVLGGLGRLARRAALGRPVVPKSIRTWRVSVFE